jgi:transcriptional regulator with XRE-family HTH domain
MASNRQHDSGKNKIGEKHRNRSLEGDNSIGDMFNQFPMLNVAEIAKAMGVNRTLMQHYINGRKRPSAKRAAEIEAYIHSLGAELKKIRL